MGGVGRGGCIVRYMLWMTRLCNVLKSWPRARRRKEWRRRVKVITRNYVLYFEGN